MFNFFYKQCGRVVCAVNGILHALRRDASFSTQFFVGGLFIAGFWQLMRPLSPLEASLLILSWVLVLITELQNSAFEDALDTLHPESDAQIGRSKDMAAGSVLLAGLFALGVVLSILIPRIL